MTSDFRNYLVSPQVHADRCVTFRLRAPRARTVIVKGIKGQLPFELQRDEFGVWSGTLGPLPGNLYAYVFEVDGADHVDPQNRVLKKWLNLESQLEVPADPPALHERTRVPHGTIHQRTYDSGLTASQRSVWIYTPPGHDASRAESYPVVYLLHGYGDDESAWTDVGRVHCIVDNLLAASRIQPVVIVMPNGHALPLDRQRDFDDYAYENIEWLERELLDELAPFVESAYQAGGAAARRAIVGLSMGGGQSLTIGLNHPEQFAVVGGFSAAAPDPERMARLRALQLPANDLSHRLHLLWIACGSDDFLLPRNQLFVEQLRQRDVAHHWQLTADGHDWFAWRAYLAEFLTASFPASV